MTSNLILQEMTLEDIPTAVSIWYEAFQSPEMRQMFPDTVGVRHWWYNTIRADILDKPQQKYVKVMAGDEIIGYAKWDLSTAVERYLPWHPEMDHDACDKLTFLTQKERERVVGDKRYYYLDMLAVHPAYQRKGAGSLLVKWGCGEADKDGVAVYVDATSDGTAIYERFGFVDLRNPESLCPLVPMLRG